MEPTRMETLLDHGWSLIGQLHQWLSMSPQQHHVQDALVELISGLQSFWARVDDLGLKRLARNSIALEQFFERLCAKRLAVTSDFLQDVNAVVANLEDLLLGFEATGEEPPLSDIESLHRIEHHTWKRFSSEPAKRTIEVIIVSDDSVGSIIRSEPVEARVPRIAGSSILIPETLSTDGWDGSEDTVYSETTLIPKRIEQKFEPRFESLVVNCVETSDISKLFDDAPSRVELNDSEPIVESNRVWILEESLFYRHLIEMVLRSAGYETETAEPTTGESFSMAKASLLPCLAILVTSSAATEMSGQIQQSRQMGSFKVIGLKGADGDEDFDVELDACVFKSKPQQLISVLDQLLNPAEDCPRKIA